MTQCPRCGAQNRDTARFCSNCSGPLRPTTSPAVASGQLCPNCQATNKVEARFCKNCGQPLSPRLEKKGPTPIQQAHPSESDTGLTGRLSSQSRLADRYIIWQKVGQGGMGAVYKAIDTQLQQSCAIKEMSSANLNTIAERQYAIARFKQEAEMLAKLNHPNLPRVSDHFSEGDRHYMVMEYIEGETLDKRLVAGQSFSEVEVYNIAQQLCQVLEYLHSQQPPIIFRDLKPSNIIIGANGQVKLIDFGIVRLFKPGKAKDTQLLGTPGFAAPEAYGNQTDARSDIFSLGMTLYCLLTVREPPRDIGKFQPAAHLSGYSPTLSQVIVKATQVKRDERWSSATEMHKAITTGNLTPSKPSEGLETQDILDQPTIARSGGIRGATQRLTQTIAPRFKRMSNIQLAAIAVALIAGMGLLTWLLGPWLANELPWLWDTLPLYYIVAPFAYSVSNRKGSAILVHAPMHLTVAWLTTPSFNFGMNLVVGLISGAALELILAQAKSERRRVWFYMAASLVAIILSMGIFTINMGGGFDIKDLFGAVLVGFMAYAAGEVVWGIRGGV